MTILDFIVDAQDDYVNLSREDTVPRFWANSTENDFVIADLIMVVVGVCFGVIHCIAWSFSFPTHVELLMWRVLSVTITTVPAYTFLMTSLTFWLVNMDFDTTADIIGGIATLSIFPAGMLYIVAQAATLVLAFTSLRDLPPGAYDTILWTIFIPHV